MSTPSISKYLRASLNILVIVCFILNGTNLPLAQAAMTGGDFRLPTPGVMVHLSPPLDPPILAGIKVHPDNPFRFEFILDQGDSELNSSQLKDESAKLIKYFLASLTIPEKDLWVNLSPYEKDRVIPTSFGRTEMGRDLLAEDYILKQITASLIYPEDGLGKKFWNRVYEEAVKKYGTTNIPVNTFNKVWIVPENALVYENPEAGAAYVVESKLKVMLEEDYLSLEKHEGIQSERIHTKDTNQIGSQVVREIVLPELTREVNEGKNFTRLRQVYNSLILATWYKKKIKDSILAQVYEGKNKVAGVQYTSSVILSTTKDLNKINSIRDSSSSPQNDTEKIYQRYLRAFKKGVYNYIKEDVDPVTQEMIPRKYFSGGVDYVRFGEIADKAFKITHDESMLGSRLVRKLLTVGAIVTAFGSLAINAVSNPLTVQAQEDARQSLQKVLNNVRRVDGPISMNRALHGMGFNNIYEYANAEWTGYEQSTYLKRDLTFSEVDAINGSISYVESTFDKTQKRKRSDGRGYDFGFDQVEQAKLSHGNNLSYYLTSPRGPVDYVIDSMKAKDRFWGESKVKSEQLAKTLGLTLKYFKLSQKEWEFICFRVLYNRGPSTKKGHITLDEILKRALITVNEPELRLSDVSRSAAKAVAAAFGRVDLDIKTLPTDRHDERDADLNALIKWINANQQNANFQKGLDEMIKSIRKKYAHSLIGYYTPPNLQRFDFGTTFKGFYDEYDNLIIEGKSDVAQLTHDQAGYGGIDLTAANMHLQTKVMDSRFRGNDKDIQFHLDPVMLKQLQNVPGFTPVIINIQPTANLRVFLGLNAQETVVAGSG